MVLTSAPRELDIINLNHSHASKCYIYVINMLTLKTLKAQGKFLRTTYVQINRDRILNNKKWKNDYSHKIRVARKQIRRDFSDKNKSSMPYRNSRRYVIHTLRQSTEDFEGPRN